MSEEDQQMLTESVAWYADTLAERIGQRDEEVAEELRATEGVTVHTWSEEAKREFRQIAQEQWAPFAERSENAQRVYETLTEYLSSQGLI